MPLMNVYRRWLHTGLMSSFLFDQLLTVPTLEAH
jgi:hypothetical protein